MGELRDEDIDYEPIPKKGKGGKKKGGKKGRSYSPPASPLPQDVFERIEKIFQKPKDFDIKVYRLQIIEHSYTIPLKKARKLTSI